MKPRKHYEFKKIKIVSKSSNATTRNRTVTDHETTRLSSVTE